MNRAREPRHTGQDGRTAYRTSQPMTKDTEVPSHVNPGPRPDTAGPAERQARKDF